jgi:predicted ATP-grasp superfamily ATP-dependent carboligase
MLLAGNHDPGKRGMLLSTMKYSRTEKVVITGADSATGLGTARALRGVDAEIIGLYKNRQSRYCKSNRWDRLVPVEDGSVECYYDTLISLGKSNQGKAILFPTQDGVVELVSNMRDSLYEYYNFVFPEKDIVDMLMDKTKFHGWATENHFPVPESYIATSKSELDAILETIQYPVIIKPLYRTAEWDKISPVHKVFKLDDKNDVDKINFNAFTVTPKLIVQKWIPGDDSCVLFCLAYYNRNSDELGFYTGKKILQHPIETGSTAISIGIDDPFLHDLTTRLFKEVNYKGLGSVEVKVNRNNNMYYITEPTVGRNDLQSNTALAGGINLTKIAYYDALWRTCPQIFVKRKSAIWIEEYGALQSSLYVLKHKNMHNNEIIKSLSKNVVFSHFAFHDPSPFLALCKELLSSMEKKYLG